jgi:hypothetical protein
MAGKRKSSNWRTVPGGAEIELTQGLWATIDIEDVDRVAILKWNATWNNKTHSYVAVRRGHKMSRLIMNAPRGMMVDHVNHDTLDNRKANLRICTATENARNTRVRQGNKSSIFKGVCWNERLAKWQAYIKLATRHLYLGSFAIEIDAARAYNAAAGKYFGEFACTNDISGG